MKTKILSLLFFFLIFSNVVVAAPLLNSPAPKFSITDINGVEISNSNLKGKIVVLEWTNYECPFVKKHYNSENMQKLQTAYKKDDNVIWISVNSSAQGKQGFLNPKEVNSEIEKRKAMPDHFILDDKGELGKLFEAKTTPHMFVIDQNGLLAYMGAIDSVSSTKSADIEGATNYVKNAVDSLLLGKEVEEALTSPYGCSVKY